MGGRRQDPSGATYVQITSESDEVTESQIPVAKNGLTNSLVCFCQRAIWILAGSTLVGFALCTLWWDPISLKGAQEDRPTSQRTVSQPGPTMASSIPERCNPFNQRGYLHYNQTDYGDNTWRPYRKDCPPSNLFAQLKEDLLVNPNLVEDGPFKWLENRTVVLIGDSIDRWHLFDFCTMLSEAPGSTEDSQIFLPNPPAETFFIGADSPLSPPPWHFHPDDPLEPPEDWPAHEHELFRKRAPIWEAGKINANTTRPRVCRIPKYGFTAVNLFTWGLDPKEGGRLYANSSGYYPPAEYTSRVENVLVPLLTNLAEHFDSPNIVQPDLIEMSSGFWDLRQWSEEDFKAIGREPDSWSPLAFTDLDEKRLDWWTSRMMRAVKMVSNTFPEVDTPILWRSLHHTKRHFWVAFSRVFQIDELARYNLEVLKKEDPVLKERLRIDETGALMLGQEHHFRDVLHVAALPGAVLWADVILWELRRAVEKRGCRHYNAAS
ncbi:hypothetical protein CROQUDRAFT_59013 [Cronartium quercuum f. sp. fusiforme G11]|uniref:Uncharacterized protein n=1 Tax=Cronartium quercuum f. sp. fusiforme G11 TaxID=708437 RepID=A0A9P6NPL6_9BASI|nr:hypothetical protein CROQUDRAFT_59013 [Cronartium quercuum f. sp. fusiforme G11]